MNTYFFNCCDLLEGRSADAIIQVDDERLTRIQMPQIPLDSQQLAELGHLLIALAGNDYEKEGVIELLDGFELSTEHLEVT